jgi:hypothetical protein
MPATPLTISPYPAMPCVEVIDLREDSAFASRSERPQNQALQMQGMQRIARAFVQSPEAVLQELVDTAMALCGADSAVISVEKEDSPESGRYQWVAAAGQLAHLRDSVLPHHPSACTLALDRGGPQRFRLGKPFFETLGMDAPPVTDGLLLPWQMVSMRGTICVMAHGRSAAFTEADCRTMQMLADFASIGIQMLRKQKLLVEQARISGATQMANHLAHRVNNPLQSLTNILYLAADGHHGAAAKAVGQQALAEVTTLSALVSKLLSLPGRKGHCTSRFTPRSVPMLQHGPQAFGNLGRT